MLNDLLNILKRVGAEEGVTDTPGQERGSLLPVALESYQHTIEAIGEHTADVPRGSRDGVRRRLKSIRHQLKMTPDKSTIEATRKQVEGELRLIGKQVEEQKQAQENEVKQIMGIVATLADSVASREQNYQVRFRGIAKKLRLLTTSENLAAIRQQLAEEVGQLERYCEDMSRDTQVALDRMKTDMTRERRPAPAAVPAMEGPPPPRGSVTPSTFAGGVVDPATGCHSRGEGLSAIQELLKSGGHYSVMLFTISNGPALVQRHSARTLDNLANSFAQRLRSHFPEAIILCRDSQWDFLALMQGGLPVAAAKAHDLELRLSGSYRVKNDTGGDEQPSVDCQTGAVQPLLGEALRDVLQRLIPSPVR